MEAMATDDKSKPHPPALGSLPPPSLAQPPTPVVTAPQRMPMAPDRLPNLPPSHGIYEQSWRPTPYPPGFEAANAERRQSTAPTPILSTVPPTREPVQASADPFSQSNGVPTTNAPTRSPHEASTQLPPMRQMNGVSMDPGPPPGPPPTDYRDYRALGVPYAPPTSVPNTGDAPMPTLGPYGPNVSFPMPPTPGPFDPSFFSGQLFGTMRQRKSSRAQQACDQCRARKAKCDEGRPACSHCKENNLTCVYKELPPHKQDKSTIFMVEKMHEMEDRISRRVDRRIDRLETRLVDRVDRRVEKLETRMLRLLRQQTVITGDNTSPQSANPSNQGTSPPVPGFDVASFPDIKQADLKASASDSEDDELSIPIDHTTGAHNLLSWPTVRRLIGKNITENYVMDMELGRGKIRLEAFGEGPTAFGSDWSDGGPARTMASSRPSPNSRNEAGPSSSADWGTGLPSSFSDPPHEPVGGLDEFGQLNTDPEVVRRLVRSYLTHMHILHPFLDEIHLKNVMEQFIRSYGRPREGLAQSLQSGVDIQRAAKRKRLLEGVQMVGNETNPMTGSSPPPLRIEETIENAILLLVMAVGAICEWRDRPLPAPVYKNSSAKSPSSSVLPPELSSSASIFRRPNASSSTPAGTGRRTSVASDSSRRRNVDVIPGFAYYAYGVRIISVSSMFTTLEEAQAGLLAGLYMGQLADPVESFGWIKRAADACISLTRKDKYQSLPKGRHKSLCEFAYWTNLQLESDILAELPLPGSNITKVETKVELPAGDYVFPVPNCLDAPNTRMMVFYLAQIHLRKVLNRIHNDLYKTPKDKDDDKVANFSVSVLKVWSKNLEHWRDDLPAQMQWNDFDPPHPDINMARLRAKYYGARYIVHRPLLYLALHYYGKAGGTKAEADSEDDSKPQRNTSRVAYGPIAGRSSSESGIPLATGEDDIWQCAPYDALPLPIRESCEECVRAAILSTTAFDGIKGRPVVTNIFGTAQAQFGNMLVLSATYMSELRPLVDRDILRRLLKRTIRFLLEYRYISPTLITNAEILMSIHERIFGDVPSIDLTS